MDTRRREESDLLRDFAAEGVADDAGAIETEIAHEREDIACHISYRVVVAGHAALADVAIVRQDGAQTFEFWNGEVPGGVVAHGSGEEDDGRAGAAFVVPEAETVMDKGRHAEKDAQVRLRALGFRGGVTLVSQWTTSICYYPMLLF